MPRPSRDRNDPERRARWLIRVDWQECKRRIRVGYPMDCRRALEIEQAKQRPRLSVLAALEQRLAESRRKGHWPKGRRAHEDGPIGRWPSRSSLARAVVSYAASARRSPELAAFVGTHRKTLWRWRMAEDIPGPRFATRLLKFAERERLIPEV